MKAKEIILRDLVAMSRNLGEPERDHGILGEGNTSARIDERTFFVKGRGEPLRLIEEAGFMKIEMARALALLGTKVDPDAPGPTLH